MNSTVTGLIHAAYGVIALGGMFLAPGYVVGCFLRLFPFDHTGRAERLLWSVLLSMPLAIAVCALAARHLSPLGTNVTFAVLDVLALVLAARHGDLNLVRRVSRSSAWMLVLMALFGAYCLFAVVDLQIGHRLYVSAVIADWSVRVAMVQAAMRSGVPPINGLSALGEHAPHLRYYYFWYVVVAQMARTIGIEAQAALAASCVWAGWSLIAAYFLAIKYMLGAREHLRGKCFLGLLVGAVLGLDIVPTALLWFSSHFHPYPEMEWWHQDRTPSFLGAVLYAPHHMAAFAALIAGFLVLLRMTGTQSSEAVTKAGTLWRHAAQAALFAGIAFAAASGTSLFPTFCFLFVLSFWAIDLLRRREWLAIATLAAAGVVALLCAHPYLKELAQGSSAATGIASPHWRNDDFVAVMTNRYHLYAGHGRILLAIEREPLVILLDAFDFGFFWLVLFAQMRRDLRRGRLGRGECALWAWILGAAVPCFFLTSTATSGPNDLGVDAGFLLRMGLEVWAVAWVWYVWHRRRLPLTARQRIEYAAAGLLFVLGLSASLYQIPSERLYYAVVGSNLVHKQMDDFTKDRLGERFYNIRSAYAAFDRMVPPSAPDTERIQFNPIGIMQPAETIYANRQIASWDTGCGTSYGGDYLSCAPVYHALLYLYGNTETGVKNSRAENDVQDGAAPGVAGDREFQAICSRLRLRAMVAESTDSIWSRPTSWVWTEPVMVANSTVRILACPQTN